MICWWMQNMFFSTGFRLKIKGIRASEKEAPVLALAPHSTFYDAFPVVVLTAPSLVVKADTQNVPFFASMNKKPTFSRLFLAFFVLFRFFPYYVWKSQNCLGYCLVPFYIYQLKPFFLFGCVYVKDAIL